MTITIHELKSRLRSVLIWSLSLFILIFVFLSLFESFSSNSKVINELIASYPKELLAAFGMLDLDLATILGFFGLIFVFCQMCLGIQAANYGFSLVSIEESELTADFLLSKPVGRAHILTSKLLAALTALTLTNLVVWAASLLFLTVFSQGQTIPAEPFFLLMFSIPIFQVFFLSVGMMVSLLVKRVRNVTPFSMGLVFGLYILNTFSDMPGAKSLEILSPFKHFAPSRIINHSAWDLPLVMISVMVIILSTASSYLLYKKRDIASAV